MHGLKIHLVSIKCLEEESRHNAQDHFLMKAQQEYSQDSPYRIKFFQKNVPQTPRKVIPPKNKK